MLGDYASIRQTYDAESYLRDMAGIALVGTVHIEAAADDPLAETQWLEEQAEAHDIPTALVVGCRLEAVTARDDLLAHLHASSRVRGVRQMLNWHTEPHLRSADRPDLLVDPSWRRGLDVLRELDLSFDLQVYPHQLRDAADVTREFPEVRFVLNHGGTLATGSPSERAARSEGLRLLARQPNVFVKLSGFGINNPERGEAAVRAWFGELLEIFGSDRAMLGSDYPVDKLHSDENPLSVLCELSGALPPADDYDLRIGTAARVYRLDLPTN